MRVSAYALALFLGLSLGTYAEPIPFKRRNYGRTPSLPELNVTARGLEKRFDNARFTFYDAGLGACGKTNSGSDFIVALNSPQWDGGSHCFQMVTISYKGKTTRAQIVDLCPGCPFGGLDMSRGLFDFFASEDLGVITGSWNFGSSGSSGGGNPAPPKAQSEPTTTKPSPPPPTTSTKERPSPTPTTSTPTSPTTRTTSTSTSSSSDSTPSDSPIQPIDDMIDQLDAALLAMGGLVVAAAQATN